MYYFKSRAYGDNTNRKQINPMSAAFVIKYSFYNRQWGAVARHLTFQPQATLLSAVRDTLASNSLHN
jgi:hypothetical protein